MIPEFPNFKNIELSDRQEVEKITSKYPPYSDFNFSSMWSWDTEEKMKLSLLNNNLVVKFTDYITSEIFYSFLGNNNSSDTAEKILNLAQTENLKPLLKLVPEDSIKNIDLKRFKIEESRDHFDYILDNKRLIDYNVSELRGHASFKRRFLEMHSNSLDSKILNLADEEQHKNLLSLNEIWVKNKILEKKDVFPELEHKAIKRMLILSKNETNFNLIALFHQNKMIAFAVDELLKNDFSIRHFMKADNSFKGIYSYLLSESSRVLIEAGKKYTNIEQDLGLKNLRQAKKSFDPVNFLKKYTVALHN
jgi:hypothetical protein